MTNGEYAALAGPPVVQRKEELRGRGLDALDCLRAASWYEGDLLKRAIKTLKYRRVRRLAEVLGDLVVEKVVGRMEMENDGVVLCPVPLHWTRRFARGFNQAELIARAVSGRTGIPVARLLRRTRPTGSQTKRRRVERLKALDDAFAVAARNVPVRVVLMDDLSTTGATLNECARVLKAAGAEHVEGWVVAHG